MHTPTRKDLNRILSILLCPDCRESLCTVKAPCCKKCSRPLPFTGDDYCDICKKEKRFFDSGAAILVHDDTARKILYDLKFHNKKDNAELIGFLMALRFHAVITKWDPEALVPVPLHKKRLLERGFNQADLIAQRFSFWLQNLYGIQIPVTTDYLLRTENTLPQRTLPSGARSENVKNAFSVTFSGNFILHSVILIDDIFTSGSTVSACAKALKKAGCRKVYFLTASIV